MQLKSVCFVKIYISSCCVDTYLNSSRTDSKEKRCRAEADPSPRPSRGEGSRSLRSLEPRSFFLQGHFGCAADRSPLHCPGQGSREGSRSLRSDVALGGCCFRAFCCRASVVCGVVLPAGGRTGSVPVRASVPGFPFPHALFL